MADAGGRPMGARLGGQIAATPGANRRGWMENIQHIYARMKQASEQGPYRTTCAGVELLVLPGVYAPGFFTDSEWFAQALPRIIGTGSLLEIGTGTGVIALACAERSKRVVATDINPEAIRNATRNATSNSLDVQVIEGDLYAPLAPTDRFDFIFWAHPFNNWPDPVTDMLERSGLDHNYDSLRRYIEEASRHLTERGRLLLGTGNSADLATLSQIAERNGYIVKVLRETTMPIETGGDIQIQYLLCELVRASGANH